MSTLSLIFLLSRFHTRFWSCRTMITRSLLFIQKFCDGSWNLVNIIFMPKCNKSLGRQYRKVHRDSCANISHTSRIRFFAYFFTAMRYPLHIRIFYPGLLVSHTYKQMLRHNDWNPSYTIIHKQNSHGPFAYIRFMLYVQIWQSQLRASCFLMDGFLNIRCHRWKFYSDYDLKGHNERKALRWCRCLPFEIRFIGG